MMAADLSHSPFAGVALRGTVVADAALTKLTWFRTGGPADWLFEPADPEDLGAALQHLPEAMPITVLGVGSNTLVRDGGIEGVVVHLPKAFATLELDTETAQVQAGAAATGIGLAQKCQKAGLGGLEFLRGIPGTIGGAVAMNAGAYGGQVCDRLISATIVTRQGHLQEIGADALKFAYRQSQLPQGAVVVAARFQAERDEPLAIAERLAKITAEREASQPVRTRTGGSTFKNPPAELSGSRRAWELIEAAGCRGLRRGNAQVSPLHCNFLINLGAARAADLEELGEEVRKRVKTATGVELTWEIKRIGRRELRP